MTRASKSAPLKKPNGNNGNALKPAIQPRLRVFLSVDLVGSTAFKRLSFAEGSGAEAPLGPSWFKTILDFYQQFEEILLLSWREYNAACEADKMPIVGPLEFWKSNGDELLYTFETVQPKDVAAILLIWKDALRNYRDTLRKTVPQLDVKSTAWTAGFPVMNTEVIFKQNLAEASEDAVVAQYELRQEWYKKGSRRVGLSKDYIGPSIDTGFRLAQMCSPRRLVISVELALLLTGCGLPHPVDEKFRIFFDGTEVLKGVLGGRPYPIIWIAVDGIGPLVEREDTLLKRTNVPFLDLLHYCEDFISEHSAYLYRPFIYNCSDENFRTLPPGYEGELKRMQVVLGKEAKLEEANAESLAPNEEGGRLAAAPSEVAGLLKAVPTTDDPETSAERSQ